MRPLCENRSHCDPLDRLPKALADYIREEDQQLREEVPGIDSWHSMREAAEPPFEAITYILAIICASLLLCMTLL